MRWCWGRALDSADKPQLVQLAGSMNAHSRTDAINNTTSCSSAGVLRRCVNSLFHILQLRSCQSLSIPKSWQKSLLTSNTQTCLTHISPNLKGLGIFHPWFSWNPFESPRSYTTRVCITIHSAHTVQIKSPSCFEFLPHNVRVSVGGTLSQGRLLTLNYVMGISSPPLRSSSILGGFCSPEKNPQDLKTFLSSLSPSVPEGDVQRSLNDACLCIRARRWAIWTQDFRTHV